MPIHEPIGKHKEINADWLTGVLRDSGHDNARVASVTVESYRNKPYSNLYRLIPKWRAGANPALPDQFILKLARVEVTNTTSRRRRRKEHAFYTT
ncbi:MAG: hypothetical protein ACR2J8_14550, partial [Thermomicrobiales bacterium]